MSAQEALELAVVNKVFPQEKLLDACREFLRTVLLQKAPIAVWAVRKSLNIGPEVDLKSACELDLQLETVCFASQDFHEGVTAFIDKRQPVYNGK
jgi:enoyl-CoA hydratase